MTSRFPRQIVEPNILAETRDYTVKIAKNHEEVEMAQRLRYEVFNLEQKRGLKNAERYGIDFDEFDEYCLHLLVMEKSSGAVLGTYRAHLGCIANSAKGFYSSKEYEIHGLYSIADKCLELGRTCVSPAFRSGAVISLLWSGITELTKRANLRYLLGCVSLDGMDPVKGWAIYHHLSDTGALSDQYRVIPRPGFRLEQPPESAIKGFLADGPAIRRSIPPIFKGYLRLGARICSEPALDRDFGTIDFFILLDITQAPDRYKKHFNYPSHTEA